MMEQWKDNPSPRIFYNFFSFNPEISPQIFLSQVKLENIPCSNAVPLLNRFVSFWIFKFLPNTHVKVKRLIKNSSKERETWSEKEGNERDDGCNFLRLPKRRNKKKKKNSIRFNHWSIFFARWKLRRIFVEWWFILSHDVILTTSCAGSLCCWHASYSWQLQLTATYIHMSDCRAPQLETMTRLMRRSSSSPRPL